jgi:hypothetical protein
MRSSHTFKGEPYFAPFDSFALPFCAKTNKLVHERGTDSYLLQTRMLLVCYTSPELY